ncbi:hypothetical protein PC111_g11207 [Phytophthora cactorum]|nr:hypothetical protein PC111_g11207 [Phytophthora cactorum]
MTRRLHDFTMEDGASMAKHLDSFDKLVARQLVVLLSSLPTEYELIGSIIENAKDVSLIEVKEQPLKEYEQLDKKETTERAFQVSARRFERDQENGRTRTGPRKTGGSFQSKCFTCNKFGHMKPNCTARCGGSRNRNGGGQDRNRGPPWNGEPKDDAVFAVGEDRTAGWLIDIRATSHMTPHRSDPFDYEALDTGMEVMIIDGKKLRWKVVER